MLIRLHPCVAPELALNDNLVLRHADPADPAQLWQYDITGRLTPAGSVLAVTAVAGSIDPDFAPLSYTDHAQRWLLRRGRLCHPATGLVLRPEHSVPVQGSRVLLGTPTDTDTQCWLSPWEPGTAKEIS